MLEINKVYNMDCLEGLKKLDTDSIDLICSDPPYQLSSITRPRPDQSENGSYGREVPFSRQQSKIKGFMGKEWDVLPTTNILKECLRVLKPGAFAFWLMTPRQDSQAIFIKRLEKAGFMISFSPLYWAYLSGFPKGMNISKAVDKKLGYSEERGFIKPTGGLHNGSGHNIQYCGQQLSPEPFSDQAKELNGSYAGFQPKPAVEVIIVAMKPLSEKGYVDQALKNRKGITWLDDCRIPYNSNADKEQNTKRLDRFPTDIKPSTVQFNKSKQRMSYIDKTEKGRYPANLLVSDEVLDDGIIRKSRKDDRDPEDLKNYKSVCYGKYDYKSFQGTYDDEGVLSRYFDIDRWFIEKLPKEIKQTFPFLFVPKPCPSEKQKELSGSIEPSNRPSGIAYNEHSGIHSEKKLRDEPFEPRMKLANTHPTVKPIKLFSYLIILGSREKDLILDPFIGSGTLGISARINSRNFIGFEREPEYYEIAKQRIKKYMDQTKLWDFK